MTVLSKYYFVSTISGALSIGGKAVADMRSNREILGSALDIVAEALGPYISLQLGGRIAVEDWTELLELKDQQEGREPHPISERDLVAQIRILTTRFAEVGHFFDLSRAQLRYVGEIRETRNAWAHGEDFNSEDLYRALDTCIRLLRGLDLGEAAERIHALLNATRQAVSKPQWQDSNKPGGHSAEEVDDENPAGPGSVSGSHAHSRLEVQAQYLESINFAAIQSVKLGTGERSIIEHVSISNHGQALGTCTLTAQLFSAVGPLSEPVERIVELGQGETPIVNFDVSPDAAKFLALDTRQAGYLQFRLQQQDHTLAEARYDVSLLPASHWQGTGSQISTEMLAAFVQPQHPAIVELLTGAQQRLQQRTGSSAIDAYQGEDQVRSAERVDQIVEAIYDAMADSGIRYSNPPASWDVLSAGGQKVRTPQEVLQGKVATCLDSTVVLAAALEAAGINSAVWIVEGHAFLGYFRMQASMRSASTDDFDSVASFVHADVMRVIETTSVTQEQKRPLKPAAESTRRRYLTGDDVNPEELFVFAVDVAMCRLAGIYPLPASTLHDDGSLTVVSYEPTKNDSLAEFFKKKGEQEVGQKPGARKIPGRVSQWKNQLLDLSFRNRLLNFSERARFPLAIPADTVEAFEDVISSGATIELLPSDHIGAVDRENHGTGFNLPPNRRNDLLLQQRQVYTQAEEKSYSTLLRKMAFAAKTELQESGANNLYVSIGTLAWSVGGKQQRSPLILVPVNLITGGKAGTYRIELDDTGNSTPNYCLLEKLRQEFELEIPGLENPDLDASGIDVKKAFQALREGLVEANLPFHVEESVDLANLQFAKFRLWKDLDENWESFAQNALVRHLIETPTDVFQDPEEHTGSPVTNDLDELGARCPVPADASQLEAVAMASNNRTFVLEGPPGTGKSQTITNLLATAMAEGKRVLFIAEKRAALEVVQKRLEAVGLGAFTLDLHDKGSKVNDVRQQIKASLDFQIYPDEQGRSMLEADLRSVRRRLSRYADRLHEQNASGFSVYSARTQELAVESDIDALPVPPSYPASATVDEVNVIRHALNELADKAYVARPVTVHPWGFVARPVEESELPVIVSAADELTEALQAADAAADTTDVQTILAEVESRDLLFTISDVLRGNVQVRILDAVATSAWQTSVQQGLEDATALIEENAVVGPIIAPSILNSDLEPLIASADEAAASGFLGIGRRRKIMAVLATLGDSWRGSEVDGKELPGLLRKAQEFSIRVEEIRAKLQNCPGLELADDWYPLTSIDLERITAQAHRLTVLADLQSEISKKGTSETQFAVKSLLENPVAGQRASDVINRVAAAWEQLEEAVPQRAHGFLNWTVGLTLPVRWTRVDSPRGSGWEATRNLTAWNEFLVTLEPLYEQFLFEARDQLIQGLYQADYARQGLEKGLAAAALQERMPATGLSGFNAQPHELQITEFANKSDKMRKHMMWWLPQQILAHRQEDLNKHSSRVGALQRQLNRQRGGMGVRSLMTEYWDLISRAMPCTLVSPDSVARFFPPHADMFDLVVFDEASQVRVADAVGAIGRGNAVVVVGDSKQMPPTSVAAVGTLDEEDIPEGLVVDEESILSECEQARIPRLWLSWHYRSQDEALIAFSNHMYYDSKLASFPAPRFVAAEATADGYGISLVRVDGHFHRSGEAGVDAKLKRTNPLEARAIVNEIKRRFEVCPGASPSLGVVTFNMQQRTLIESMIRDETDQRMAASLDSENEGLFVKNLENVQGDERDVIFFSTAFSPNDKGILPLNFGPLNNPGGERRLNVAVTRARRQVVVFSSFDPEQLRAEDSSSIGIKHLRTYLELAARGPEAIPSADNSSLKIDRHRDQISAKLRDRGYSVRTNVGLSEFKVDITLASRERPDEPILAVLLDHEEWAQRKTVGDRDGLPHQVLEGVLDWPGTIRVWMPEWLSSPEQVLDRIDEQYDQAVSRTARGTQQAATDSETAAHVSVHGDTEPTSILSEPQIVPLRDAAYAAYRSEAAQDVRGAGQALRDDEMEAHAPVSDSSVEADMTPDNSPQPTMEDDAIGEVAQTLGSSHVIPGLRKYDPGQFDPQEFSPDSFDAWWIQEVGEPEELDRISDPAVTQKIRKVAADIVMQEWPIKQERLARLINNAFWLKRVSTGRARAAINALERGAYRTDKDGFVWPAAIDPDGWYEFRTYNSGDDVPQTDISPVEIANAMAYISRDRGPISTSELKERMKYLLGFTRMGAKVSAWFDYAMEVGISSGRLSWHGEQITVAGQWAENR